MHTAWYLCELFLFKSFHDRNEWDSFSQRYFTFEFSEFSTFKKMNVHYFLEKDKY